jgi:hypothetical protein
LNRLFSCFLLFCCFLLSMLSCFSRFQSKRLLYSQCPF